MNAFLPDPAVIDYSAAKAALTNLCKSLSKEFGGRVRVNTISPGPVQTDLWLGADGVAATVARASGATPDDGRPGRGRSRASTGRFTRPDEIADLVALPGQRPGGQHHRQRLRHRRRPDHAPREQGQTMFIASRTVAAYASSPRS